MLFACQNSIVTGAAGSAVVSAAGLSLAVVVAAVVSVAACPQADSIVTLNTRQSNKAHSLLFMIITSCFFYWENLINIVQCLYAPNFFSIFPDAKLNTIRNIITQINRHTVIVDEYSNLKAKNACL